MAIHRERNREQFTIISNMTIRDMRLSNKELGALVRLLSVMDDWRFSVEGLKVGHVMPDGKDSISHSLKKLEEYGYLQRTPKKGKNGIFIGCEWEVYECCPSTGNRETGNLETENPTQSINDKPINYKSIKECVGTLSEQDYLQLATKYGKSLVDEIIKRIKERHYSGCLNRETIAKWCDERRQRQPTTRASAFSQYPQRDYDFEAYEKEILGE